MSTADLLVVVGAICVIGFGYVTALMLRGRRARACSAVGTAFLLVAALIAVAAVVNPDPGINAAALLVWLALLGWGLIGLALARTQHRVWILAAYLVPSTALGYGLGVAALGLRFFFKTFA